MTVNRAKTRVVRLCQPGASLTFLGFALRYDRDRFGRDRRYLNVFPSARALARARDKLRELTGPARNLVPIPVVVGEVRVRLTRQTRVELPGAELVRVATPDALPSPSESPPLPCPGG